MVGRQDADASGLLASILALLGVLDGGLEEALNLTSGNGLRNAVGTLLEDINRVDEVVNHDSGVERLVVNNRERIRAGLGDTREVEDLGELRHAHGASLGDVRGELLTATVSLDRKRTMDRRTWRL